MISIVQIPQIYVSLYIIVFMWAGTNCTIAKEVCRLEDKKCHENRMHPFSGSFHLAELWNAWCENDYDTASYLKSTGSNFSDRPSSFLLNTYLESMAITYGDGNFGFWLEFLNWMSWPTPLLSVSCCGWSNCKVWLYTTPLTLKPASWESPVVSY